MIKRNIYCVGGHDYSYTNWMEGRLVDTMEEADLVMGVGGSDWHPSWYYQGKRPHPALYTDYKLDVAEKKEFELAVKMGKPIVGICRSSQGLCVLAGGELVQHQGGQGSIHDMITIDGDKLPVSSMHHNAQYPFRRLKEGKDYKLLGWTNNTLNYRFLDEVERADSKLPEAEDVFYTKLKALAIQSHPEVLNPTQYKKTISYYRHLLDKLVEGSL